MADDTSGSRGDVLTTMSLALIEEQADASIRREWIGERWYFSVVDVIGVLTDSATPRKYWHDMQRRIQDEGFRQLSANCRQLKLRARDGKRYATDAADTETLLRIIQSVPSPKAEPVKQWLAKVGAQRLDEANRPPLDPAETSRSVVAIAKPAPDASALLWARYYEQLAALCYRQASYEQQLTTIDAQIVEHDAALADHSLQLGEVQSRLEAVEATQRELLPELLERLKPPTLSTEHQAAVRAGVGRLHEA
ncbi:MAG TPA: BRO family protein, partial [Ktedonobacterales bacterium]|nr:BRO family protein [Ktedonobacterales bacterium]